MVIATIAWAVYSWMLSTRRHEGVIAETWATVVMAQVFFGLNWSASRFCGDGVAVHRLAYRLELGSGAGHFVRGHGSGFGSLALLGRCGPTGGCGNSGFLCEPDAGIRCADVGLYSGRHPQALPRRGFPADCGRDLRLVA